MNQIKRLEEEYKGKSRKLAEIEGQVESFIEIVKSLEETVEVKNNTINVLTKKLN